MTKYMTKDLGSELYKHYERRFDFCRYKIDGEINPFRLIKYKPEGLCEFVFAPSYNYLQNRKIIPEFNKKWAKKYN